MTSSKSPIKVFWDGAFSHPNFGDSLSPKIVEWISGRPTTFARIGHCDLVAIGSILDHVIARHRKRLVKLRFRKIQVWGSGSFGTPHMGGWRWLDIRAVRGPLTRDRLGLPTDTPMGDPALLINRFTQAPVKKYRWGIIPHVDAPKTGIVQTMLNSTNNATVIDLGTDDVLGTAQHISKCDFVISSSLHGLIAADTLGVPNVWMHIHDIGGNWKFYDYFASVGRPLNCKPIITADDLRKLEKITDIANPYMLANRQRELENSFKELNL